MNGLASRLGRDALACALLCGASCGGGDSGSGSSVDQRYQALAVQLQNCADDALDCLDAANCDDAAMQECRQGFWECRQRTREAYRAFHQAVRECFHDKWQCIADAGWDDAGAEARAACREELHACIAEERPIPGPLGPCMQGLRDCVHADVADGERPSHEQVHDCLGVAHQCVLDRLPMCGPDDEAGAGGASAGAGGASEAGAGGAAGGAGGASASDAGT